MRTLIPILGFLLLAACAAPRSYTRATPFLLPDAFACAQVQLQEMDYMVVLADPVGGILQGQREITGVRESARKGAAAATEIVTAGLAGGKRTRFDELTVFVYMRRWPEGNTVEAAAGMLTVGDDADRARSRPTEAARTDARGLVERCAPPPAQAQLTTGQD